MSLTQHVERVIEPMISIYSGSVVGADKSHLGSIYVWSIKVDGVVYEGASPTVLEALRDAGNMVYEKWGYARSMGRLKIDGEIG